MFKETTIQRILNFLILTSSTAALTMIVVWVYGLYNPKIIYVKQEGTTEIVVSQVCEECLLFQIPVHKMHPVKRNPPIRNVIRH